MKIPIGLILSFFLAVAFIEAQTPKVSPTPVESEDCGLTDAGLVTLNVSVWSKNKGYLKDLTDKNFEIFDGKAKQPIDCFKLQDEPISVGVLFDFSDSIQSLKNSKISETTFAVDGLISFINASNPKNEYFIIGFAKETAVLLEPTQDKKQIENALKTVLTIKPEGNTSLYDAMKAGFEKISGGKFKRKILLVISDGMDNNSKAGFTDIKKQIRQADVAIYQINIIADYADAGSLEAMQAEAFSQTLADASGGSLFYPKNRAEVIAAFEMLVDELKSQYQIALTPKSSGGAKKDWHEIKINLNLPQEKREETGKVFIRARKGFYF